METMQAIILNEFGLENLMLKQLEYPACDDNSVIVKLKASALNHRDVWIVQKQYPNIQLPAILGSDGAGIVVEVGKHVSQDWLNQTVIINPSLHWGNDPKVQGSNYSILGMPVNGTQSEFIHIPATQLAKKPDHLTFEEAAALPLAGLTAYRALFTQAELTADHTIVITGIGGGVATILLLLAVSYGARVFVTSSSQAKLDKAMALGAAGGVLYTDPNWIENLNQQTSQYGINSIIDSASGNINPYLELLNVGGRLISFGMTRGFPDNVDWGHLLFKQIRIQGTIMGNNTEFQALCNFINEKKITPIVDRVIPFHDFQTAYQTMLKGDQQGKIVLQHDC